jgi:pilus assembly protein Flp/PilA
MRLHTQVARGQGLVEYALILVLVAIVVIGTLSLLGKQTSQVFDQVNCGLAGGTYHQDNGNGNSNKCK